MGGRAGKHPLHVRHQRIAQRRAEHVHNGAPGIGRGKAKDPARAGRKSLDKALLIEKQRGDFGTGEEIRHVLGQALQLVDFLFELRIHLV
jgi:hypothetical protein